MRTGFSGSCLTAKAWLGVMLAAIVAVSLARVPADARPSSSKSADPAVAFMEKVARDLLAGAMRGGTSLMTIFGQVLASPEYAARAT